jgi:hypothetical protein
MLYGRISKETTVTCQKVYFGIHLDTDSINRLLFVTGSVLSLIKYFVVTVDFQIGI